MSKGVIFLAKVSRIFWVVLFFSCALFALDAFVLPDVTPELKKEAREYFDNECKGCHRWARKFAAPPMHDNAETYASDPEAMVRYLMKPTPQHPDEWPAMEINPLTQDQAKMMTAWLLYLLKNPDDSSRPR